jgi:hypothetical protein
MFTASCYRSFDRLDQRPCITRQWTPAVLWLGGVGIHKRFGARKKTGSEPIFLRIDFKISFFHFLQLLFTEKVSVLADFFKKIDLFEKD